MSTNSDIKTVNDRHPAEVIADYLEEHGWTQYVYKDKDGACCISGACIQVFGIGRYYLEARTAVEERLGIKDTWFGVAAWNDKEGRTQEEVLRALRGQDDQ